MKYIIPAFLFIICSCGQQQQTTDIAIKDSVVSNTDSVNSIFPLSQTDEYLITDTSFGKIKSTTTFADLENMFGKTNLQDTINYIAEGTDSVIVTEVYPNTPKELIITWHNFHKRIDRVESFQPDAPYRTTDSLKIGSTLESLLNANGKKITFTGTSWDYGGIISSYHKGKYDNSKIFFRLTSAEDASNGVMGDHELNTDMPLVKQNLKKLYIMDISLTLNKAK